MKAFIAICCVLSAAHGSIVAIVPSVSHYHSQDDWGQYSYGYHGGPSAKQETRTLDGVTSGGYSYVDANNVVQTVSYVSDPVNGFRVAATNLPQQAPHIIGPLAAPVHLVTPPAPAHFIVPAHFLAPHFIAPVPLAPIDPVAPIEPESGKEEVAPISPAPVNEDGAEKKLIPEETPEAVAQASVEASTDAEEPSTEEPASAVESEEPASAVESEETSRKRRSVYFAAPLPYYYSPISSSQYEVKDHLGQYTYGYNDGLSAKAESRSFDGTTSGGYSYLDSNGLVQNVNYIADSNGFRVAASNLPVAVKSVESPALVAPVAIKETEEVAAARAAHLAAYDKLKAEIVTKAPALVAPVPVEETPEVAAARAAHLEAHEKAKSGIAA